MVIQTQVWTTHTLVEGTLFFLNLQNTLNPLLIHCRTMMPFGWDHSGLIASCTQVHCTPYHQKKVKKCHVLWANDTSILLKKNPDESIKTEGDSSIHDSNSGALDKKPVSSTSKAMGAGMRV